MIANPLSQLRRHGAPVSIALIAMMVVTFLAFWLTRGGYGSSLLFTTRTALDRPWTFLTWPLTGTTDLIGLIFGGLWLWFIGALVEREVGSSRFALLTIIFTALSALSLYVGSMIVGTGGSLAGPWLILSVVTVIFGTRYPNELVRIWAVLPVKAKWLAWVSVGLAFFSAPPALAIFAALPLALVYLFAADKLPIPYSGRVAARRNEKKTFVRGGAKVGQDYFDRVKEREREREEKERLRKLFEDNMIDNSGEEKKD
jgi:membrane associated rhomboid family serine protease